MHQPSELNRRMFQCVRVFDFLLASCSGGVTPIPLRLWFHPPQRFLRPPGLGLAPGARRTRLALRAAAEEVSLRGRKSWRTKYAEMAAPPWGP